MKKEEKMEKKGEKKEVAVENKNKKSSPIKIILKIIAVLFLIVFAILLVGSLAFIGLSIYGLTLQLPYYGIYILSVALFLLVLVLFLSLLRFVINHKQKVVRMIIGFALFLIFTGIGGYLTYTEVKDTKVLPLDEDTKHTIVHKEEVEMNDDMVLLLPTNDFIRDNSLGNKVIVEFTFNNLYFSFEPKVGIKDNRLEVDYSFGNTFTNSTNIVSTAINLLKSLSEEQKEAILENLKEKKIYLGVPIPEIKIYASEKISQKINENRLEYYKEKYNINDLDNVDKVALCKEELEKMGLGSLKDRCNDTALIDSLLKK